MKNFVILILVFLSVHFCAMEKDIHAQADTHSDSFYVVSSSSSPMKFLHDKIALKAYYDKMMQQRIISSDSHASVVDTVDVTKVVTIFHDKYLKRVCYDCDSSDNWDWNHHATDFKILYAYKQKSRYKRAECNYIETNLRVYTKKDFMMHGMFNPQEEERQIRRVKRKLSLVHAAIRDRFKNKHEE